MRALPEFSVHPLGIPETSSRRTRSAIFMTVARFA